MALLIEKLASQREKRQVDEAYAGMSDYFVPVV